MKDTHRNQKLAKIMSVELSNNEIKRKQKEKDLARRRKEKK